MNQASCMPKHEPTSLRDGNQRNILEDYFIWPSAVFALALGLAGVGCGPGDAKVDHSTNGESGSDSEGPSSDPLATSDPAGTTSEVGETTTLAWETSETETSEATTSSSDTGSGTGTPTDQNGRPILPEVRVPAGKFWRGCNDALTFGGCDGTRDAELPYAQVELDEFFIDRFEVPAWAYMMCVQAGVCEAPWCPHIEDDDPVCSHEDPKLWNHPAEAMTWQGSHDYCEWVGRRLPTEAEWEKAARGTDGRTYPWGEEQISCTRAVVSDPDDGCGTKRTMPIGSKPAGASVYGMEDALGNVGEWVADYYDPNYYATGPLINPPGPTEPPDPANVMRAGRGGTYRLQFPEISLRGGGSLTNRAAGAGFRCARSAAD